MTFDWMTWSIWFIGLVILIIWIVVPIKEYKTLMKARREKETKS